MPAVCCIWWMVCLQMRIAAAATTLAGCDSGSPGNAGGFTLSVPTLVLCTPTLLCMLYSWWMLRASPWHDMSYVEKPPVTVLIPPEPLITEDAEPVSTIRAVVRSFTIRLAHHLAKYLSRLMRHAEDLADPHTSCFMYATYWFRPSLTELLGAAKEPDDVNRISVLPVVLSKSLSVTAQKQLLALLS